MSLVIEGEKCSLISRTIDDFEWYWFWQNNGDWRNWDAPWEHKKNESKKEAEEKYITRLELEKEGKRNRLWINANGKNIGSVSSYNSINNNESVMIGIAIYESDYQGKGIGEEALSIWIKHLFEEKKYHKIGLETYTFNSRMIRTAERIGFVKEGMDREIRFWKEEWISKIRYGMLKEEYDKK
jgi:RimJ/RimL family protein N-acetyltransferase